MSRRVSAKTRVKLSQAAKKRRRGLKGTSLAGQFLGGISTMSKHPLAMANRDPVDFTSAKRTMERNLPGVGMGKHPPRQTGPEDWSEQRRVPGSSGRKTPKEKLGSREQTSIAKADFARNQARIRQGSKKAERDMEYQYVTGRAAKIGFEPSDEELLRPSEVVRSRDIKAVSDRLKNSQWRQQPGVYSEAREYTGAGRPLPPGQMMKELAPAHREWLEKALQDPQSEFNRGLVDDPSVRTRGVRSVGARGRRDRYLSAIQQPDVSHEQALGQLRVERRGRPARADRLGDKARQGLQERKQATGRKSKYESVTPTQAKFQFGREADAPMSGAEIRKRFKGLTEEEYVKIQEKQLETIFDRLQKNQAWAHETRRATLQGKQFDAGGPDRVVVFTTSLGRPAPSVPSDSLLGQYIINRRKRMLKREGIATDRMLRGRFPQAVRDMHIVELSTGAGVGFQGRAGAFSQTGWRAGAKKSKGFGTPRPAGASILYDSSGRPMYDQDGNIRWSEGATRPVKVGTDLLGLRVFVG